MSDDHNWHELIDRHLRGELSEHEMERLAERLDSDSSARREFVEHAQWDTRFADVLRESCHRLEPLREPNAGESADAVLAARTAMMRDRVPTTTITRTLLALAAVAVIVLAAGLYFQRPGAEPQIATITGLSGPLQWTGSGGRVFHDLSVGTELPGGTVEGLAPDSWFELEFSDGSTVTITGDSMLTFSDQGQKILHLKEGNMSGDVQPQPRGNPMLVYTRSAVLEVLGTQFGLEAELWSTVLNVSEGKVRIKRLSDGSTVEVPAKYRVIAAADRDMSPVLVPDPVSRWQSQLHRGPENTFGDWSPGTDEADAKLKAVPFSTSEGKTIFTTGFGVSCGDHPPVLLHPDSLIRVRGHISSAHRMYYGVTLRDAGGEFAGRFQTIKPAARFQGGQDFEVVLQLRDYQLDPSLNDVKNTLPSAPFGFVVESIWCHTLYDPAGLEITKIELVSPAENDQK